jgi:uncharacterized phage-associated protein
MVASADVARYLIHLASPGTDEDEDCLTHLALQKLLYYVQGWHIATAGTPLFQSRIEAWTNGPVVRELYPQFKQYGCGGIPPSAGVDSDALPRTAKMFIRSVWLQYRRYSASELRNMTHRESPWIDARGELSPSDHSETEITPAAMEEYFRPLYLDRLKRHNPRIDPAKWQAATEAFAAGRTRTTKDIRRELRRRSAGADPR